MTIDLSYRDIHGNKREAQETANCYVINKPGSYCFPLVYGNSIKDGISNKKAYTKYHKDQKDFYDYKYNIINRPEITYKVKDAKIVCSDSNDFLAIQNIHINKNYVFFDVTQISKDGANYILGIYDEEDKVIWSWHLWLWGDELRDIKIDNDIVVLNINLASKKSDNNIINAFYQWGRKDPLFINTKIIKNSGRKALSSFNNISDSIKMPDTFIISDGLSIDSKLYSKIVIQKGINYWNANYPNPDPRLYTEIVEKTIYDPCPCRYHVPRTNINKGLINGINYKNGIIFNNALFLYTGCLFDGIFKENDITGNYWCSSPYGYNLDTGILGSTYISINKDKLNYSGVRNIRNDQFGASVRPQKE